jgi:hypothetical protein
LTWKHLPGAWWTSTCLRATRRRWNFYFGCKRSEILIYSFDVGRRGYLDRGCSSILLHHSLQVRSQCHSFNLVEIETKCGTFLTPGSRNIWRIGGPPLLSLIKSAPFRRPYQLETKICELCALWYVSKLDTMNWKNLAFNHILPVYLNFILIFFLVLVELHRIWLSKIKESLFSLKRRDILLQSWLTRYSERRRPWISKISRARDECSLIW